jgi:hypothetical protein
LGKPERQQGRFSRRDQGEHEWYGKLIRGTDQKTGSRVCIPSHCTSKLISQQNSQLSWTHWFPCSSSPIFVVITSEFTITHQTYPLSCLLVAKKRFMVPRQQALTYQQFAFQNSDHWKYSIVNYSFSHLRKLISSHALDCELTPFRERGTMHTTSLHTSSMNWLLALK